MNKAVVGTLVVIGVLGAAGGGYWFGTQRMAAPAQSTGGATQAKGSGGPQGQAAVVAVEAVKVATAPIQKNRSRKQPAVSKKSRRTSQRRRGTHDRLKRELRKAAEERMFAQFTLGEPR